MKKYGIVKNKMSYFLRRKTTDFNIHKNRLLALTLTSIMLLSSVSAYAQEFSSGVVPTYDEAYYGVLDYYGNLKDGSVVKSYTMNGATKIIDHGNYLKVNNLTNGIKPNYKNGIVTFEFNKKKLPDHFYFEGKNSEIYGNLPWKISMTYKLNGVPAEADELAGEKGVVEIDLNIVPNEYTSEYAKNNYTLEALTVFNQSDILSLEQEGGQVQMIGNLRTVIFAAMPGAEEHFKIWVGSDEFEFSGFTFIMAPATLSQIDMISDLQDKKDKIEDNYNKLNNSLDKTLNALADMEGSLNASASGLDKLNAARETFSNGKGQIYDDIDISNNDLNDMVLNIDPIYQHIADASKAISDSKVATQTIVDSTKTMGDDLKSISKSLDSIKGDLDKIKDSTDSLSKNNKDLKNLINKTKDLSGHLENISDALDKLDDISGGSSSKSAQISDAADLINAYNILKNDRKKAKTFLTAIDQQGLIEKRTSGNVTYGFIPKENDINAIKILIKSWGTSQSPPVHINDQKLNELAALIASALEVSSNASAFADIENANGLPNGTLSFILASYKNIKKLAPFYVVYSTTSGGSPNIKDFSKNAIIASYELKGQHINEASAEQLASTIAFLYAQSDEGTNIDGLKALIDNIDNNINGSINNAANTLNNNINSLARPTSELMKKLSDIIDDLDVLSKTLDDLEKVNSSAGNVINSSKDIIDNTAKATDTANKIIEEIDELQKVMNDYEPKAQDALKNMQDLSKNTASGIRNLSKLISDSKTLSRKSGNQLDKGTRDTLSSLSDTLKKTANAVGTAKDVKQAKDDLDEMIRDIWDDHTGDIDNILNMDNSLPAQSLTSPENRNPVTIQVLVRSQEIIIDDSAEREAAEEKIETTTFWDRVKQMFVDIGHAVTNAFK